MPSKHSRLTVCKAVTLGCDAGDTCGPNNLCQPLLEKVYQAEEIACLKAILWILVTSYFLDLSDIPLNMFTSTPSTACPVSMDTAHPLCYTL